MKFVVNILAICSLALFAACDTGSSLPEATGKGTVRTINAIETAPDIGFFIEQRLIGNVAYKGVSGFSEWDDLEYTFNFEVTFAGNSANTRIASRSVKVNADQDYTFLLTGTVAAPTLSVFETAIPQFTSGGTSLQIRFAHTAASVADIDVYFAADGVVPAAGNQVATLTLGQIADPQNFEAGSYVLTLTTAGDPADILFTSNVSTFNAGSDIIVTPFDGDYDDTAPIIVRALGTGGAASILFDANYPSTIEFLQASQDLGVSDIYDDEALTSLVLANHNYLDRSVGIPVAAGTNTYRLTPAGDTAAITVEGSVAVSDGLRYRFVTLGESGSFAAAAYIPDRRPIVTAAKILMLHASNNYDFLNFYIVNSGVSIDGLAPFRSGLGRVLGVPAAGIAAGEYDVYITESGTTEILAGPIPISVALGDVLDFVIFDTADPAVLNVQILPLP